MYAASDPVNLTDPTGAFSLGWDDAADFYQGLWDIGGAAASAVALGFGGRACVAAIASSGPAAPFVAVSCGVFVAGHIANIGYSTYSAYNNFKNIGD